MSAYNGLLNVLSTVTGLTVIGYPPASVSNTQLPCAIVAFGPATHTWQAYDYRRTEREWQIYLVAAPAAQSTLETSNALLRSLVQQVVVALMDDPTLGGQADHIVRISDDGIGIQQIAGADYLSVLMRVLIVEKWV